MKNKNTASFVLSLCLVCGTLLFANKFGFGDVNVPVQAVTEQQTALVIKGATSQLSTMYSAPTDVTSTAQGTDSHITVLYSGKVSGSNGGIFNNTSQQMRLYNSSGAAGESVTITTKPGYSIYTVAVTWSPNNNGNCNYVSGTIYTIDSCSCTISNIGNSSGTANGQVRISQIDLVYFAY